jgi:hypothetical protein
VIIGYQYAWTNHDRSSTSGQLPAECIVCQLSYRKWKFRQSKTIHFRQ